MNLSFVIKGYVIRLKGSVLLHTVRPRHKKKETRSVFFLGGGWGKQGIDACAMKMSQCRMKVR